MPTCTVTTRAIAIDHIRIESTRSFSAVRAALEGSVPSLDPSVIDFLREGNQEHVEETRTRGPKLSIFLVRDHGASLQIAGSPRKALQYEIGNPITATLMTRHRLPAALYAPLRVVLYESDAGHAVFEYDRPSSLFGQFGDEQVTEVALGLDAELERALCRAAE